MYILYDKCIYIIYNYVTYLTWGRKFGIWELLLLYLTVSLLVYKVNYCTLILLIDVVITIFPLQLQIQS